MGIANSFGTAWTVQPADFNLIGISVVRPAIAHRSISEGRKRRDSRLRPDGLFPLGQPFDLRPQLLEAFLPHQFLKLATIASIRVQFLDDDPAQCIKAILTAGLPVAFRCHLLLGRECPRLPVLALVNHRLASVLKALDRRPQRVTFLLQFIDTPSQVFRRLRLIRDVLVNLELVGGLGLPTRSSQPQLADRRVMPAVRLEIAKAFLCD